MADTYKIDRLYSPFVSTAERQSLAKDLLDTGAAMHVRHIEEMGLLKNRIMHVEHAVDTQTKELRARIELLENLNGEFTRFREYAEQVQPGIHAAFLVKHAMEDALGD